MACFSLLRLLKSSLPKDFDVEKAKKHLLVGINLAKRLSNDKNDTCSKTATILTQLWDSPEAFKHADGSPDVSICVYHRLQMGIVLDAVWRWLDLFDERKNHTGETTVGTKQGLEVQNQPTLASSTITTAPGDDINATLFDDQIFADFSWALGDDFFSL